MVDGHHPLTGLHWVLHLSLLSLPFLDRRRIRIRGQLRRLSPRVNVIPVIGKADSLTPLELKSFKKRVSISSMYFLSINFKKLRLWKT